MNRSDRRTELKVLAHRQDKLERHKQYRKERKPLFKGWWFLGAVVVTLSLGMLGYHKAPYIIDQVSTILAPACAVAIIAYALFRLVRYVRRRRMQHQCSPSHS